MKSFTPRAVAGLLLTLALVTLSSSAAIASDHRGSKSSNDNTTTTSPTETTFPFQNNDPSTANAQKTWREEMKAYRQARFAISEAFKSAVSSASAIYAAARVQANTAAARSTARAAYVLALTQAVAARDAALNTLGNPPAPKHARVTRR